MAQTPVLRDKSNVTVLCYPKIAILCSVKCPGKLILAAYDTCRHLRETDIKVIGGFDSPMEEECLQILLRGSTPVIWCLARGKLSRIPPAYAEPVSSGRLTIHAPFPDKVRYKTVATCAKRNRIVADMADAVLVVHAAPGGKIESLSFELLAAGKRLYTYDHPANAALISHGAKCIDSPEFEAFLVKCRADDSSPEDCQ